MSKFKNKRKIGKKEDEWRSINKRTEKIKIKSSKRYVTFTQNFNVTLFRNLQALILQFQSIGFQSKEKEEKEKAFYINRQF